VAVGQLDRLVEVAERRHADERAERLGVGEVVVGAHAVDDRRVHEQPPLGIAPDEARARVGGGDPPRP
jgi:hypothetical protein